MTLFKNFKTYLAAAAIVTTSTSAMALSPAGLFVEPGVTYESLDTTINWSAPFSDSTGTSKGLGVSARLGLHVGEIVFLALDARYAKPTFTDSATDASSSATSFNYGPVVGIQTPIVGLRVWGQYVLDGSYDPEKTSFMDYKFDKGNGYRVGVGMHVAVVSINLEYQDLKYKTSIQEFLSTPVNASLENADLSSKGFILGVSFPIEM